MTDPLLLGSGYGRQRRRAGNTGPCDTIVVPQLLARPEFIDRLADLAQRVGAEFAEVLLRMEPSEALERLAARAAGSSSWAVFVRPVRRASRRGWPGG